jgi:CheY-like chemotaxis protein
MKTIFFVEDDPVIVQVYRAPLVSAGYQVEVAADGLDAMRAILPMKPALVVLDLFMPKVDGTYVLKFIRSKPELAATKVILLSDATIADVAQQALALNPDRVFLKSQCSPKQLAEAVVELLGPN